MIVVSGEALMDVFAVGDTATGVQLDARTFQAAMLTALAERGWLTRNTLLHLRGPELQSVLAFAAQAAAITCSRRGADLPSRKDLPLS